jgi:hypothetical protein
MRDAIPGYFMTETDADALWDDCLFVPDTNTLLNLYRYNETTRQEYLTVFKGLQERLWIPAQVAEEFMRGRESVKAAAAQPYKAAMDFVQNFADSIERTLKSHYAVDVKELVSLAGKSVEPLKERLKELDTDHPKFFALDTISAEVERLFQDRTGKPYGPGRLLKLMTKGEARFLQLIPPGYVDFANKTANSSPNRFGDYILWCQVLGHAKKTKKSIVFITGDMKEDWYLSVSGSPRGPRPELLQEMWLVAGVRSYIYTPTAFCSKAGSYLKAPVAEESLVEVERVTEEAAQRSEGELREAESLKNALFPNYADYVARTALDKHSLQSLGHNTALMQQFHNMSLAGSAPQFNSAAQALRQIEEARNRGIMQMFDQMNASVVRGARDSVNAQLEAILRPVRQRGAGPSAQSNEEDEVVGDGGTREADDVDETEEEQ